MIRQYCDCCDAEITDKNKIDDTNFRLTGEIKRKGSIMLSVEVITSKDKTWNDGDFCKYCIIDAINEADDRPKEYGQAA